MGVSQWSSCGGEVLGFDRWLLVVWCLSVLGSVCDLHWYLDISVLARKKGAGNENHYVHYVEWVNWNGDRSKTVAAVQGCAAQTEEKQRIESEIYNYNSYAPYRNQREIARSDWVKSRRASIISCRHSPTSEIASFQRSSDHGRRNP